MTTKTVRVEETVLEKIKAHKREDETLSDTIERLIGGPSLLDLVGLLDEGEADEIRATLESVDEADEAATAELLDRVK